MELTMLDFLAQLINNQKAKQQGYTTCARWLTTNQDLKDKCKAEAQKMFDEWKADELKADENRKNILKDVQIKYYEE